jgi:hypothetical protein
MHADQPRSVDAETPEPMRTVLNLSVGDTIEIEFDEVDSDWFPEQPELAVVETNLTRDSEPGKYDSMERYWTVFLQLADEASETARSSKSDAHLKVTVSKHPRKQVWESPRVSLDSGTNKYGIATFSLTSWDIDDIRLCSDEPPAGELSASEIEQRLEADAEFRQRIASVVADSL